jgi:FdhE protein
LTPLTRETWLEAHPYLQPVAQFCAQVDRAAAGVEAASPAIPCWDDYIGDFQEGVPLLRSTNAAIDLEPAGRMVVSLAGRLASEPLAGRLAEEASALDADLRRDAHADRRVVDWLLGDDSLAPASPGLLRYLGWTVMARYLLPVVEASAGWRNDERWLRNYCPTCGSAPAMAQLIGTDPGRRRLLSCGCCGTRWQYKRTGCPFCESDSQRLASVTVEGEAGLRIDYCESCRGYLKTYDGQGNEAILLSDWTSLHLDLLAHDRGLKRLAVSLYELSPLLQP